MFFLKLLLIIMLVLPICYISMLLTFNLIDEVISKGNKKKKTGRKHR